MSGPSETLVERVRAILDGHVGDPGAEARAIAAACGESAERAAEMAADRAAGKPLGYVLGVARFMGIELAIAPGALVPREETELLGRTALEVLSNMAAGEPPGNPLRLIDMCCGSGNLACALAAHLPQLLVWGSDLTDGAVGVARKNVERLELGGRVQIFQGDLFAPLAGLGLEDAIDVVVCNPPYISTGRLGKDRALLLEHEPREAFDGGPYGVSIQQQVVKEALPFLRTGGVLMFEIGAGQERQVELLFKRARAYEPAETRRDASGETRVLLGKRIG